MDGILLLDKPEGITSNDALQQARKLLGAQKAGHTGSLDNSGWHKHGKVFGVTKVTPGLWHHYAVSRSAGIIYLFLDGKLEMLKGVQDGSHCRTDFAYPGLELAIGGTPDGARTFHGWIDELRVSNGVARWTSSFTPHGNSSRITV